MHHPDRIYTGTSGWSYTSWKPDFYPQKTPAKKLLAYYAKQLNSVEVNYTFRSLPTAAMLAGWLAATGPGFRFSFKAPQRITHLSRLQGAAVHLRALADALSPVIEAGRMGVILFQLPPTFKADSARLAAFLQDAAALKLRLAFEFRHASWFTDETYELLGRHQAALCLATSDELSTPEIFTAPFSCYRLRKSRYTTAELKRLTSQMLERARTGEVFAYFKHEEKPTGALRAVALREAFAG